MLTQIRKLLRTLQERHLPVTAAGQGCPVLSEIILSGKNVTEQILKKLQIGSNNGNEWNLKYMCLFNTHI